MVTVRGEKGVAVGSGTGVSTARTAAATVGEGLGALLERFQAAAEGAESLSESLLRPAEALAPLEQAQAGATAGAAET